MAMTDGPLVAGPDPPSAAPSTPAERQPEERDGSAERRMADALRALTLNAIEAAGSGHPGLASDLAAAAAVLWTRFHKFDSADPDWPDRDRFVLSAADGAPMLYALLHLTGQAGMGADELRRFGEMRSPAIIRPEFSERPGVEACCGPPGQGIGMAVGMALAERMLAARFGRSLVDHRTWVVASEADLAVGVAHEAACLAGELRLDKLTVILRDADPRSAEQFDAREAVRRFAAYGWAVKRADGADQTQLAAALSLAVRAKKPMLIVVRTARDAVDANPIGAVCEQPPEIAEAIAAAWRQVGSNGAAARRGWIKRLARHPQRAEFERVASRRTPDGFHDALAALKAENGATSSFRSSHDALRALAPSMPELIGGSVESAPALGQFAPIVATNFAGRMIAFGPREQGMAAALNGIALHGGLVPFGVAPYASGDAMRAALRLAAAMRGHVVHALCPDDAGEDGACGPPAELLAGLRALPNLAVFRPADALETAECWEFALRRVDGPSVIVLSRGEISAPPVDATENRASRGGYVLAEAAGDRRVTLIASGGEVALARQARDLLAADGIVAAVVSLPCWELFARQDEGYRRQVLGSVLRVGIEAATGFGWERWLGDDGIFIGVDGFGSSGAGADVYKHFGITPDAIAATVRRRLA